jgi:hypothetical protein
VSVVITVELPDPRLLHHFPEAALLAALDATLAAAELALREEHPTVDDLPWDPEHDVPPSLVTAHLIITRTIELRALLDLYRAAVLRAVGHRDLDADDF